MGEVLRRYKGLAPWVGMALTVLSTIVVNVWVAAYSYGVLQQRQADFEHRLAVIETSDRDQSRQISDSANKLARIEEGVTYIREAIRRGQ